jgi:hypothetical protein
MTDHRVRLIFSTDFGERLKTLDLAAPTWIVGSPFNNPAIEELWRSEAGNITKFGAQDFDSLIGTIDEHHPSWRELEVHGLACEHAQSALGSYNGSYSSEDADVFVFIRGDG